jgi:putative PEP-CTERM system TPR-repeat lipoprotein
MIHPGKQFRIAAASLALASVITACGKDPESHLRTGKELFGKSEFKSAALELKSVLQEQPNNMEARLLLGQTHFKMGEFAAAEKELGKAKELGATDEQILPMRALAMLRIGEHKKLLETPIPNGGLSPRSIAMLQTARAEAFLVAGKRAEAEAAISAARQADANLPELLLLLAKLAVTDKHPEEASKQIEALLKADPKSADARYIKSGLLQSAGKVDDAMAVCREILANDPTQFRAHLVIASLEQVKGNFDGADKALQAAEKLAGKNPMVLYARGAMELQRGKLDKANAALLEVLKVAPDHTPSLLAFAATNFGLGHYSQSLKDAGKVLGTAPDNLMAAKILAGSQLKLGDPKGAQRTIAPFLGKYPNDSKLMALAGEIHLQNKEFNKAMSYFDKASELDPGNVSLKTRQAAGQMLSGDSKEAVASLEKAVTLSDKPGEADMALVLLHIRNRSYDKALQAIASLEKKLPNNPITLNLRATVLLNKQDRAGARKALEQALSIQPGFFPAAFNLARMDAEDKRPQDARKRFESILATDKNNVKAMLALADLAKAENQEKTFVDWMEKALKADPKLIPTYEGLVRAHMSKKDPAKALATAKRAVDANPESPAALELLGSTQLATGDKSAAVETFSRAVAKAPQSPDSLLRLAIAQTATKQTQAARSTLTKALQLAPDSPRALETLIQLEMLDIKPDAALRVARDMQTRLPKSPIGFEREGDILGAKKQYPAAIKAYDQALAKGSGATTLIKLHRALITSGDSKGAEQRLSSWLKQHPKDIAARAYAAEVYTMGNRNREAIALYEEVVNAYPNHIQSLNNLANLYQREKDSRALGMAERAYKLAPSVPGVQDTLGWILVEQGQATRGLDLLRKALEKVPSQDTIRYHYAVALAKTGNTKQARLELDTLIKSKRAFPELEDAKTWLSKL